MTDANTVRANRILCAATAVEEYRDNLAGPETLAVDLLTDLRHFCDLHGLDFATMDRRAHDHYLDEQETAA